MDGQDPFKYDNNFSTYIGNGQSMSIVYPVRQYLGSDIRGLRYKEYLLRAKLTKDRDQQRYGYYVWRNGEWVVSKRLFLDRSVVSTLATPATHKLPRSIRVLEPGAFLYEPRSHSPRFPHRILRAIYVQPGGEFTRAFFRELYIDSGQWLWSYGSISMLQRYTRTTFDELAAMDERYPGRIVEANLML